MSLRRKNELCLSKAQQPFRHALQEAGAGQRQESRLFLLIWAVVFIPVKECLPYLIYQDSALYQQPQTDICGLEFRDPAVE